MPRIVLNTKAKWSQFGFTVKPDARPIMLPFIPTSEENLHIRNVQVFTSTDVEPKAPPDLPGRFTPYQPHNYVVRYRQGFGAARNQLQRMMDVYWWTPPIALNAAAGDFDVVAKRRTVIYPPSLFKGRRVRIKDKVCLACDKVFKAKRKDAKYCSPACRKWASRKRHI